MSARQLSALLKCNHYGLLRPPLQSKVIEPSLMKWHRSSFRPLAESEYSEYQFSLNAIIMECDHLKTKTAINWAFVRCDCRSCVQAENSGEWAGRIMEEILSWPMCWSSQSPLKEEGGVKIQVTGFQIINNPKSID